MIEPGNQYDWEPQNRDPQKNAPHSANPYENTPGGGYAPKPPEQGAPPSSWPPQPPPDWRPSGPPQNYGMGGGYPQGYPPYQNQPPRQNQPADWVPYQYNPNSGWQHPRYEWNMNDYAGYDSPSEKIRKPRKNGFLIFILCLFGSLAIGLSAIVVMGFLWSPGPDALPADVLASAVPEEGEPQEAESEGISIAFDVASKPQITETLPIGGRMTIPQVAEFVSPSVVSVVKYRENQIYSEATGIGSGIILSDDGYIVTNAHVVEGGSTFKVQLYDGTPYDARLIAADTYTDLAVLKVDTTDTLRPAQFGDSGELLVGETVVAIGNPVDLSFAGSVTQGIVSAVNREVSSSRYSVPYIQTDAAINPGNSGGALANEFGQVIGINTAKIFRAGYEGMGFAIPISEALPIIDDLLMHGWVTGRVKLGIDGLAIDAVDAVRANLVEGVIIKVIDHDSDLNNHNVIKDDVITHVNGERVFTTADIHDAINGLSVGDEVELSIYRRLTPTSDSEFKVKVKLIESRE